jgi:hypothetical protein
LYPFHPQHVQDLHPENSVMRLEFCHWLHTNRQLLPLTLFTDEATFTRNGIDIRNLHRWSDDNPHGTVETNFQHCFSSNVWCGMIDDMLTDPVILDYHMTGHNYLDFLQNGITKTTTECSFGYMDCYVLSARWSPHYTRLVMQHLNDTFPNSWIGHGSTINWPPRSPDLTPSDFCLWGWMKSKAYRRNMDS